MARRVYFAFHYRNDIWKVNQIRNSNTLKELEDYGFYDASLWEESQKKGSSALKRLINGGLEYTSVTSVLIGTETYSRPWVRYEIFKSYERNNGLLGIYIHNQKDKNGYLSLEGPNPFDYLSIYVSEDGNKIYFYEWLNNEWKQFTELPYMTSNCNKEFWNKSYQLSNFYPMYDWINDDGYNNMPKWIETAAKKAGR